MKKGILTFIIAIFVMVSGYSQNYDFDLLAHYRINVDSYKHDRITYANSKNDSYFLSVTSSNGKLKGVLYDLDKFIMFTYLVNESKVNDEIYFDFVYVDSVTIKYHKSFYGYEFTKEEIKADSISKTIIVNAYEGKKRKKAKMSIEMDMIEAKSNLFPLFRFCCFHPFELLQNLNFSGNYLVKKAKGVSLMGKPVELELLEFRDVKLRLNTSKI